MKSDSMAELSKLFRGDFEYMTDDLKVAYLSERIQRYFKTVECNECYLMVKIISSLEYNGMFSELYKLASSGYVSSDILPELKELSDDNDSIYYNIGVNWMKNYIDYRINNNIKTVSYWNKLNW